MVLLLRTWHHLHLHRLPVVLHPVIISNPTSLHRRTPMMCRSRHGRRPPDMTVPEIAEASCLKSGAPTEDRLAIRADTTRAVQSENHIEVKRTIGTGMARTTGTPLATPPGGRIDPVGERCVHRMATRGEEAIRGRDLGTMHNHPGSMADSRTSRRTAEVQAREVVAEQAQEVPATVNVCGVGHDPVSTCLILGAPMAVDMHHTRDDEVAGVGWR